MRKLVVAVTVLVGVALAGAAHADEIFKAVLSGDEEVPAVLTEMSGMAIVHVDGNVASAEFKLFVNDGVRVTQSHIHCGDRGVNGPIFVFLAGNHPAGLDVDGKWVTATFTDSSISNRATACGATFGEIVQSIRDGRTYVNVHTVAHPGGEVRGQLLPVGD